MGSWSRELIGVELLVVRRYPNVAAFLMDSEHGAGIRGSGVLDETRGQVLVEDGIGLIGDNEDIALRARKFGGAIRRREKLEQDKGAQAKLSFELVGNIGKLAVDVAHCCYDRWGPAAAAEVELDVA